MRAYMFLLLLIAVLIPMVVKYGILNSDWNLVSNCNGPCLVEDFTNDSLEDRVVPNNLKRLERPNAFQQDLDNHPKDEMLNMDGFSQGNPNNTNGQNCQFGQCLPTQQSPNK